MQRIIIGVLAADAEVGRPLDQFQTVDSNMHTLYKLLKTSHCMKLDNPVPVPVPVPRSKIIKKSKLKNLDNIVNVICKAVISNLNELVSDSDDNDSCLDTNNDNDNESVMSVQIVSDEDERYSPILENLESENSNTTLSLPASSCNGSEDQQNSLYEDDSFDKAPSPFEVEIIDMVPSPPNGEITDKASSPFQDQITDKAHSPLEDEITDKAHSPFQDEITDKPSSPLQDEITDKAPSPLEDEITDKAHSPFQDEITDKAPSPLEDEITDKAPSSFEEQSAVLSQELNLETDNNDKVEVVNSIKKYPTRFAAREEFFLSLYSASVMLQNTTPVESRTTDSNPHKSSKKKSERLREKRLLKAKKEPKKHKGNVQNAGKTNQKTPGNSKKEMLKSRVYRKKNVETKAGTSNDQKTDSGVPSQRRGRKPKKKLPDSEPDGIF